MISVSTKMPYQEVRKISLRSGNGQGKVRENGSRKRVATLFMYFLSESVFHLTLYVAFVMHLMFVQSYLYIPHSLQ